MRFAHAIILATAAGMTGPLPAAGLDGLWSGPGTILTISASGGVLQQDCASGRFGPVKVGKTGGFKARGTWEDYQPGPQPADAPPIASGANFDGRLQGDTLTLTIERAGHSPQLLTLLKGKRAKIIRCL
jgi:hypothetical protein